MLKLRLALAYKRVHAFFLVFGGKQTVEQPPFQGDCLAHTDLLTPADGFLGCAHGQRRSGADRLGDVNCLRARRWQQV